MKNNPDVFNSKFVFKKTLYQIIIDYIKKYFFLKLTKNGLKIFLRGGDHISLGPQLYGLHEPVIKKLIEHYANNGFSDYLIDVGANIGLTSCQSGMKFKQVHMFEPNPDCFSLLEVNSKISLGGIKYYLYDFGLGADSCLATLTVPIHNWGGAFIRDKSNSYSDEILAGKDGFAKIDPKNYYDVAIRIENAEIEFNKLFISLRDSQLLSGVIKIDVEGYEPIVLAAIAKTIPNNMQVMIVFENWNKLFDMKSILFMFNDRAACFKLVENSQVNQKMPAILKFVVLLFKQQRATEIRRISDIDMSGDLIIEVKNIG